MSRKSSRREKRPAKKPATLRDSVELLPPNAAGIDIGASQHHVAVPRDRDDTFVREFDAFTADLRAIADWLSHCGIETVAMESTGVYWIPLFEMLEQRGFEVRLVNPHQLKNVPGRKTDVLDCQWIQQLHAFGLLSGAFRPEDSVCALRSFLRQRSMLVRRASDHIRHIQKALTQMNIKLQHVVSDVTGATGMRIIRAILEEERSPQALAKLRDRRCRHSEAKIAKALEGNWRPEHLFALRQGVELYEFHQEQIVACDREIEALMDSFEDRSEGRELAKKGYRKRPFAFDAERAAFRLVGVDLTQIGGISDKSVLTILCEIGLDMSKWQTARPFASWLGLSPGSKVSGGKQLSSRSRPCANRAATALRLAAYGAQNSQCPIGDHYRRMRARLGPPKAITATAHKLARIIYAMLRDRAEYDPSRTAEQKNQQRRVNALKRSAKRLGYQLLPLEVAAHAAT